jgi:outer membrane protein assembly factor BamD
MRIALPKLLLGLFAVCLLASCSRFGRLSKSTDVDVRYKGAMEYFKKKDYYHCGLLLEETLPLLKGSSRADTAQLYYAYCQFYEKQFALSAFYFKTFYETFPRSNFAEEAGYMEGLSYYEDSPRYDLDQESTKEALRVVQTFLTQYPETERKEDCNFIVESLRSKLEHKAYDQAYLYYKKGNYQAAIIAFENFRKDFPESARNELAASLKVEAAYKLASASVPSKQEERFGQVISTYESFIDKFPTSKRSSTVAPYYAQAQNWLSANKALKTHPQSLHTGTTP